MEIGAGIGEHLPEVRIRYVRDTDDFGYTTLENCFFFDDGGMYVWETDDKWKEDHNQDIVEDVFGDECRGRGFAHRVIFAGAGTGVIDSNGKEIYTGDVLSVTFEDHTLEMALGAIESDYRFLLDNHSLLLRQCRSQDLTRIGTVFFKLDPCEYPIPSIRQRTLVFNLGYSTNEEFARRLLMAKFTPNFEQEEWKYIALEEIGAEFHWNK